MLLGWRHVQGTTRLATFWWKHIPTLTAQLDVYVRDPECFSSRVNKEINLQRHDKTNCLGNTSVSKRNEKVFSFSVDSTARAAYNGDYQQLKDEIRALSKGTSELSFRSIQILLILIRFLIITACIYYIPFGALYPPPLSSGPADDTVSAVIRFALSLPARTRRAWGILAWPLTISALQFIVAPYSLFVAFTQFLALAPPMYGAHAFATLFLQVVALLVLPDNVHSATTVTVQLPFIILFYLADQLFCLYCTFQTPNNTAGSAPMTFHEHLKHVCYGFINCKTYHLVLFTVLYQSQVRMSLLPWFLDALLGLTPKVTRLIATLTGYHWAPLFYHQHRISHLPVVYMHAHKFHHFLHDTTAFDAHVYGSGLPEEWFSLWHEVFLALVFGVIPTSLSTHILYISWTNKVGHTRKLETDRGDNHHADHHTRHSKNFGIFNALMDMYFESNYPSNDSYDYQGLVLKRESHFDDDDDDDGGGGGGGGGPRVKSREVGVVPSTTPVVFTVATPNRKQQ